jgi:hypothetical protein
MRRHEATLLAALLLLYCCFTAAVLMLYCCFTYYWSVGDMNDVQAGEAAAQSVITVFDALYFAPHDYAKQFADRAILRELDKVDSGIQQGCRLYY